MLDVISVYSVYCAITAHFRDINYDYFSHGVRRVKNEYFEKLNTKKSFIRIAEKRKNLREVAYYFASIKIIDGDFHQMAFSYFGEEIFQDFLHRCRSIRSDFNIQLEKIFSKNYGKTQNLFEWLDNKLPMIYNENCSPEVKSILCKLCSKYEVKINEISDPFLYNRGFLIYKYSKFIRISDLEYFEKTLKKLLKSY